MAEKRVRRTVRRRTRNKNFEREAVIGSLVATLKNSDDAGRLRLAVRQIAEDDALWEVLESMARDAKTLRDMGISRWAL